MRLAATYAGLFIASVAILLRDGSRLEQPTTVALGAPANPIPEQALVAKYEALAKLALPPEQVAALRNMCVTLDELADVRPFAALLAGGGCAPGADPS